MEENKQTTEVLNETEEKHEDIVSSESETIGIPLPETEEETGSEMKADEATKKPASKKFKHYSLLTVAILLSGVLRAFSVHCFIIPNDFAPGGVTGISTMLQWGTGWNSGIFMFLINLPLLIASFFLITKRFAIISAIGIVLQSGLLVLLERLGVPQYGDEPVLAAVAGGVMGGAGIGLILKIGGSCGGTDTVATYIYKHFSAANVSWFIFMLDSVVVFISFFIYRQGLTPVLLSLVEMFASAKMSDLVMCGFKTALKFEIITSSPKELSEELMRKLKRGVTAVEAKGMYTGENKTMLICIVRRSQVSAFQRILEHYPDSFAYISTTNEVMGKGFISDI